MTELREEHLQEAIRVEELQRKHWSARFPEAKPDLPGARAAMQAAEPWIVGVLAVCLGAVIVAQTVMSRAWIEGGGAFAVYAVVVWWAWRICRGERRDG